MIHGCIRYRIRYYIAIEFFFSTQALYSLVICMFAQIRCSEKRKDYDISRL
jgi:hypothetical protein